MYLNRRNLQFYVYCSMHHYSHTLAVFKDFWLYLFCLQVADFKTLWATTYTFLYYCKATIASCIVYVKFFNDLSQAQPWANCIARFWNRENIAVYNMSGLFTHEAKGHSFTRHLWQMLGHIIWQTTPMCHVVKIKGIDFSQRHIITMAHLKFNTKTRKSCMSVI
jgi:hypothetical protein